MKQRKIIISSFIIAISIFVVSFGVGIYNYIKVELKDFKILKVEEISSDTILYFEKNQFATKYDVVVTNNDGKVIYEKTTTKNETLLDEIPASYGEKINVKVVAYNKHNEKKESTNDLTVVWNEPNFKSNNSLYVKENNDYILNINGDYSKASYEVKIKNENNNVYQTKVKNNYVVIPYNYLKNYSGRLTAELIKDEKVIVSTCNFYINTAVVGYVNIESPTNNEFKTWGDINFKFSGGTGANNFKLNIYENETKLVKTIDLYSKNYVIDYKNFKENTKYKLEIVAGINDYKELSKTDSVVITTGIKGKLSQVYTTTNFNNMKKGDTLTLANRFKDVEIYYTTDGTDPIKNGKLYSNPIVVNENMVIKAYAKSKLMEDSFISTFNVKIGEKNPVVYISPSKQDYNKGILGSGYTTEKNEMNKIADILIPILQKAGITVYRNNPDTDMNAWMNESNKVNADLHLALHSNGSSNHNQTGVYVYVHDEQSYAYSIASNIYDSIYNIYPFKSNNNNHGIAFAKGSLGEVAPTNVKCGVLIEYAFHDNMDEAKWIVNNREQIASSTAEAIIKYFKVQ